LISVEAEPRFDDLYRRLVLAGVRKQLGPLVGGLADEFNTEDLAFLVCAASRLALDGHESGAAAAAQQLKAYEIATRVLELVGDAEPAFQAAARLILARLGNFPACHLLQTQQRQSQSPLPAYLELEVAARQIENSIHIREDIAIPLTDFQVRLLDALSQSASVSVSAPTSGGKSFALSLEVVRRFEAGKPLTVVYLVPTRALIRQVMYDTIEKLNAHGLADVPVLCVPEAFDQAAAPKGLVYVLTQERLMTLLYAPNSEKQKIDVLIVDEAQEISEGGRGLVLETVIDRTLRRYPRAAVFFSCPLRSNPGFLLGLFGRQEEGTFFVEHLPPVSQNLISVSSVKDKPTRATVSVHIGDEVLPVAETDLKFSYRGGHLPKLAVALTRQGECSILYANAPRWAESWAEATASDLPTASELNEDIADLIEFVREHIHPKYRLAKCLEKGVAFHYGNMPQIVRARIEDMLKDRTLRFVCCTSTLLQGVNLPAKNIFIENPKKGLGNPMRAADFWNLAGRAGRLAKEFHGNVWCVFSKDWDSDPLHAGRLDEVTSAFTQTLTGQPERVLRFIGSPGVPSEDEDAGLFEQVFGRAFVDYHLEGRAVADLGRDLPQKREILQQIDRECARVKSQVTLPPDVFVRNSAISPLKLEGLATVLKRHTDLAPWVPISPMSKQGYENMRSIFQTLEEVFFQTGNESYVYHCWLAAQWMRGRSLKDLVADKVERDKAGDDPAKISKSIRELFYALENTLRYKYVKYLRAYNDTLRAVLLARGEEGLAGRIVPLHLLIEYGAYDQTLIGLMALGLSRTSAILLKSALRLVDGLLRPECQQIVDRLDVGRLSLPKICVHEILRIRRTPPRP
jgi:hypothetical protein